MADDLAFDAAGAQQVFSGEHVVLSAQQAADLAERTEGWPAGLYLAAVVAKRGGEVAVVAGDDRYFSDYLYSESLARQPEDIQRFLCRTAVLEQLCGPLCDTVLQSSSSAEDLRRLEASNLFLVPLDRRRGGTATTRCTGSSCSANFVGPRRTSSRSCTYGRLIGSSPTGPLN